MMSQVSKRELLAELRPRYRKAGQAEKQRILDELVATTGYHRKYAIQVLSLCWVSDPHPGTNGCGRGRDCDGDTSRLVQPCECPRRRDHAGQEDPHRGLCHEAAYTGIPPPSGPVPARKAVCSLPTKRDRTLVLKSAKRKPRLRARQYGWSIQRSTAHDHRA